MRELSSFAFEFYVFIVCLVSRSSSLSLGAKAEEKNRLVYCNPTDPL